MGSVKFKEPSPKDRLFATPAADRPDINLNLSTAAPMGSSGRGASIDSGATRWFDLVYGFALDGAVRDVRSARDINRALAAGDLLARTFFFRLSQEDGVSAGRRDPRDFADNEAMFLGTVEANEDHLYVSGGSPGRLPNSVMYQKQGDMYVPFLSQVVRGSDSDVQSVPIPQPLKHNPNRLYAPSKIPDELWAAHSLGILANAATLQIEARSMVQRGHVYLAEAR